MPEDVESRVMTRVRFLSILTVLVLIVNGAVRTHAQTSSGTPFGYQLFQMLFEENSLTPVSSTSEVMRDPRNSVIVLLGNIDGRTVRTRDLVQFLRRGGSSLIATDTGTYLPGICSLSGGRNPVTVPPDLGYQGQPDCFAIRQLSTVSPLTRGVRQLVLNGTGFIPYGAVLSARNPRIIASLPRNVSPRSASGQAVALSMKFHPQSDVVVCADPSIYANDMLWHGSNVIFAINTVNMLTTQTDAEGTPVGKRTKLLFVVDNRILGSYRSDPTIQQALQQPLDPNMPETDPFDNQDDLWDEAEPETVDDWLNSKLAAPNLVVEKLQEEDFLNKIVDLNTERQQRVPQSRRRLEWLRLLCVCAAVFAVWKIATRGSAGHQMMPGRTMKSAQNMQHGKAQKSAEFGRAAGILAWEFCRELTDSTDSAVWAQELGGKSFNGRAPAKSAYLQQKLDRIVKLAINTRTVHISRGEFESIGRNITKLRELHSSAKLMKPPLQE